MVLCNHLQGGFVIGGGNAPSLTKIEFITIPTTGNAQDFGDKPLVHEWWWWFIDTRGLLLVVIYFQPYNLNSIDF